MKNASQSILDTPMNKIISKIQHIDTVKKKRKLVKLYNVAYSMIIHELQNKIVYGEKNFPGSIKS